MKGLDRPRWPQTTRTRPQMSVPVPPGGRAFRRRRTNSRRTRHGVMLRSSGSGRRLEQEQLEAAALAEAESLAEALEVPLAEAAELLADDREGYVPPTALAPAAADLAEGSLLTRGTIDAYIAAVIELWRLQV
ncbi:hypothetical protein HZ326_27116, partial [Fusarium oxysporum f. sp. albedinis]